MTMAGLIEKMAKDAKISNAAAGRVLKSFIGGVTKLRKRNSKVTLVGFVLLGIFTAKRSRAAILQ